MPPHRPRDNGARKPTAAAGLAIFVGIGLSRFAYSPLIPVLVADNWFTPAQAIYLGAANLAGFLFGALIGQTIAMRWQAKRALRLMTLATTLAFFASATPISFIWFFLWRLMSGLTGGSLMVPAAPTILPLVPETKRGLAAGLIFSGVEAFIQIWPRETLRVERRSPFLGGLIK